MSRHVGLCLVLSETWTMTDPRDLRRFVDYARIAEKAGIAGVLVGEHVAMGPNSCANGPTENPRDWLMAGNQPTDFPHPSNLPILSAMAAVTSHLRLIAAAVLTALRPPLLMAKELATVDLISEGRLVVVPAVSWQREEYEAMGLDFSKRGKMLDEQLEIWHQLWTNGSPISYDGQFYRFSEMSIEPGPYRIGGPTIWAGGKSFSPWMVRRTVQYANGLFPIFPPTDEQIAELADAMSAAGRDITELEMAAVLPTKPFTDATGVLNLDDTIAAAPELVAKGYTTLLVKPSMYIDDGDLFEEFCRAAIDKLDAVLRN